MTKDQLGAIATKFQLTQEEEEKIADLPLAVSASEINEATRVLNESLLESTSLIDYYALPQTDPAKKAFRNSFEKIFSADIYKWMVSFLTGMEEGVPVSSDAIKDYLMVAASSSQRIASQMASTLLEEAMIGEAIVGAVATALASPKPEEQKKEVSVQEDDENHRGVKKEWKKA
jgi:hypothetical protein